MCVKVIASQRWDVYWDTVHISPHTMRRKKKSEIYSLAISIWTFDPCKHWGLRHFVKYSIHWLISLVLECFVSEMLPIAVSSKKQFVDIRVIASQRYFLTAVKKHTSWYFWFLTVWCRTVKIINIVNNQRLSHFWDCCKRRFESEKNSTCSIGLACVVFCISSDCHIATIFGDRL